MITPASTTVRERVSDQKTEPVLEPGRIGHLALHNRAVVAPMSRVSAAPGGIPTRQMAEYYSTFARGGFALLITEGIYTDRSFAQAYERQPGLVDDAQAAGWEVVTGAVHDAGAPILAQLMHAGALSQFLEMTAAPSAIPPRGRKMSDYGGTGPFPVPSGMTIEQITEARAGFVAAAVRARCAGFDGVEVHAANGYLLDQFITRYTNHRTDCYGGPPENRIRLTAEIIRAIRRAVPGDFVVGVRLSQTKVNDLDYRWTGPAEAAFYFAAVAEAGADYVHIASEGREWRDTAMINDNQTVTGLARQVAARPVIANGGMHRVDLSRTVLTEGHADFVALASGALANRDWPARVRHGEPFDEFDHRILHPAATLDNAELVERTLRAEAEAGAGAGA